MSTGFSFFVQDSILAFRNIPPEELPFPLNTDYSVRISICAYLLITLVLGLILRFKIFVYLGSVDLKQNKINLLIFFDQLNGLLLGCVILFTLICTALPWPLISISSLDWCNWGDVFGCIYLAGYGAWSAVIGLFRIAYIRSNLCVKNYGENKFLFLLVVYGLLSFYLGIIFAYFDKGLGFKLCSHYSAEDVEVLYVSHCLYLT